MVHQQNLVYFTVYHSEHHKAANEEGDPRNHIQEHLESLLRCELEALVDRIGTKIKIVIYKLTININSRLGLSNSDFILFSRT